MYLLSIVIATKNRYQYLLEVLNTLKNVDKDKVEIVISDNSNDNSTVLEYLKLNEFSNLVYSHTDEQLSQTGNSERAVSLSTGKYVLYIGDDDTVISNIHKFIEKLDALNIDSCITPISKYYWPDIVFKHFRYPDLSYVNFNNKIKKLNVSKEYKKVKKKGATTIGKLPKVYHGFIKKEILEKVKTQCGSYFPGPSPDMANAVVLSFSVNNHYFINTPVIISGFSYHSAGGRGVRGEHKGNLKDIEQLPKDIEDIWINQLPKYWHACTIWPMSFYTAICSIHNSSKCDLNYTFIYAKLFLEEKDIRKDILKFINFKNFIKFYYYFIMLFIFKSLNYIKNFIRTRLKITSLNSYPIVSSIVETQKIMDDDIKENI